MIRGEQVTLFLPLGEVDPLGGRARGFAEGVTLENVVVAPAGTDELAAAREWGLSADLTLHLQKGFDLDLSGAEVEVRGQRFRVIGNPEHYTPENTPGAWYRAVSVERVCG